MNSAGFLGTAPPSAAAQQLFADDVDELGYVMNASRLWAHQPQLLDALFGLLRSITTATGSTAYRGVLVAACASAFGDSYCSLARGSKLAAASDPATAAAVLRGTDTGLSGIEQALADWARKLCAAPTAPALPTSRLCAKPASTTPTSLRSPPSSRCGSPSALSMTPGRPTRRSAAADRARRGTRGGHLRQALLRTFPRTDDAARDQSPQLREDPHRHTTLFKT